MKRTSLIVSCVLIAAGLAWFFNPDAVAKRTWMQQLNQICEAVQSGDQARLKQLLEVTLDESAKPSVNVITREGFEYQRGTWSVNQYFTKATLIDTLLQQVTALKNLQCTPSFTRFDRTGSKTRFINTTFTLMLSAEGSRQWHHTDIPEQYQTQIDCKSLMGWEPRPFALKTLFCESRTAIKVMPDGVEILRTPTMYLDQRYYEKQHPH